MKRILALLAIPILMGVLVTPVLAAATLPFTTDLVADGRDTALDVGDLTVAADGTITFQIDEASTDWRLAETHLYVSDVSLTLKRSSPGKFPLKHEELGGVLTDVYNVNLAAADVNGDGIVYIAAHAELIMLLYVDPELGPIYAYETAWAQGDQSIGKGKNWATFFSVNVTAIV